MIVSTSILIDQLKKYGDPAGKILRMKRNGEIIPLTRGIYETDKNAKGHWLAGAIFGPSYGGRVKAIGITPACAGKSETVLRRRPSP